VKSMTRWVPNRRRILLFGLRRCDHVYSGFVGNLNGQRAYVAGATLDKHALAGGYFGEFESLDRGLANNRDRRSLLHHMR